jgi:HK97 family phage prohead protease
MPYYITDKAQDCSGWAVTKEDGEVIGCHTTKQGAIDQMVAVSVAENLEPGGERAVAPNALQIGDYVSWNSAGGRARGEVVRIVRDGVINVPNSSVNVAGTEDDPAALIQVYEQVKGGWRDTEVFVAHKFSTLTRIEPLPEPQDEEGERRELPDNYRPALAEDVPEGRACGNCYFFNEERINDAGDKAWCEKWDDFVDGGYYCNAWQPDESEDFDDSEEMRAVDLTPPAYMRAAARRGLEFYAEGKGGDGLVDQTIADARAMASGEVTERKWRLIAPWIARHLVDLDSPSAQPDSPEYPSAGVVAMLLWGAPANRRGAERAQAYAEGVVARLDAEQERKQTMSNRETRDFETTFEIREEGDGMTFVGYAAKFDQPSENLGGFVEYVERGAFSRSLKSRNDVMLLWNHDAGQPLASTRSGTMKLTEDEVGLRVEARLPMTTLGKDLSVLLREKIVGKMSFGFNVIKDSWNSEGTERRLKSVRLFETSLVVWPAYPQTEATVRGLDKVAQRASVDADELADVMLKIEEGADLTPDQAELMKSVVERLAPTPEESVSEEPQPSLLAVKQKQLDLLLKRI